MQLLPQYAAVTIDETLTSATRWARIDNTLSLILAQD
jgi:hypothetical protein